MSKAVVLLYLIFFIANKTKSEDVISSGCYLDSVSNPDFHLNPILDGLTQKITSDDCKNNCLQIDDQVKYAGIQFDDICLCAYEISNKDKMSEPPNCVQTDFLNQQEVEIQIFLLQRTQYESPNLNCKEILVTEKSDVLATFECNVSPENPGVQYTFNFDDGGLSSALSNISKARNEYFMPGNYQVSVAIVKPDGFSEVKYKTVEVKKRLDIGLKFAFECPQQVMIDDLLICNVTSFFGTNLEFTISPKGENCPASNTTFRLPDINKVSVGIVFPNTQPINILNNSLTEPDTNYIVISSTQMTTEGVISTIKLFVVSPGNIKLKILRPKYSTPFCQLKISCRNSASNYEVLSYEFPVEIGKYAEITTPQSVTHYIPNGPIINNGDVLAIKSDTNGVIGYVPANGEKSTDFTITQSMSYGKILNVNHMVQAIITPKTALVFGQSFSSGGYCTFFATLDSKGRSGEFTVNSASGFVLIGNATEDFNLKCHKNITIGQIVTARIDVTEKKKFNKIIWDFDGGLKPVTQVISDKNAGYYEYSFRYPNAGTFNLNVTMESQFKTVSHSCQVDIRLQFIDTDWTFTSNSPRIAPSPVNFNIKYIGNKKFEYFGFINITFNWGDGSQKETFRMDNFTFQTNHFYKESGRYIVSIVLSNDINFLKLKTTVEMLEELKMHVIPTYYFIPKATYEPGFGPNANIFRELSKIKFTVKCIGVSENEIENYYIQWTNGSQTEMNRKDVFPAEHYEYFNEVGNFSLTFTVISSFGFEFTETLDLIIMPHDWNFDILLRDYFKETDVDEPREMMLYSTVAISCVIVNFADGGPFEMYGPKEICAKSKTKDPIFNNAKWIEKSTTFPMNISHKYNKRNNYNVTLYGFTERLSRIASEMIFVNYYPYRPKPEVWILINSTQYLCPLIVKRSDDRKIETGATIAYNESAALETRMGWTIWAIDEDDAYKDLKEKNFIDGYPEPTNKSYLYIRAKFLPYGLYKVIYNYSVVKVGGLELGNPLMVWSYTYLRVISTDVVAVMIKNSLRYIERGYGQMIHLNPIDLSIDPDGETEKFSVIWICRQKDEKFDNFEDTKIQDLPELGAKNSGGGCFGNGPGVINVKDGFWNLNTSLFYTNNIEITILVKVSKNSRFAIAILDVKVFSYKIPVLDLRCSVSALCQKISNVKNLLNPSMRLSMIGQCTADCPADLKFRWKFSSDPPPTADENSDSELIGGTKEMMALSKYYIRHQTEFRITFEVYSDEKTLASTSMDFKVNKRPVNGSCELQQPEKKRALLGIYSVTCFNWVDPDGNEIEYYKAYSIDAENYTNILLTTYSNNFDLVLKPGNLTLFVEISDATKAYAKIKLGQVEVSTPTLQEFNDFVNTKLTYLRLTGNQMHLAQAIQTIQVIQTYYKLSRPNIKTESPKHLKLTEASIIYLNDLINMTFNSMEDLEVIANTAANIVDDGYNIDKTGRKVAADLIKNLDDIFNDPHQTATTFTTPYKVETYLNNILSVLGGVAWSTSNQLANSIVLEGDMNHANEIDVETGVPIGQSSLTIPKDKIGQVKQAILNDAAKQALHEVDQFEKTINNYQQQVLRNFVANEKPLEIKTLSGLIMHLERGTNKLVKNKWTSLGTAAIKFPNFCKLSDKMEENCGDESDVAYAATLWKGLYPAFGANLQKLNKNSETVDLWSFTGKLNNVTKISVTNSLDPIQITVPRINHDVKLPNPTFVRPKTKWYETMVYHEVNITIIGSSVTLMFTPENLDPTFLIFFRHKFKPYLNNYNLVFKTSEMEPDQHNSYHMTINQNHLNYSSYKFYIGVVQLFNNASLNGEVNGTFDQSQINSNFTTNYTMAVQASGCHFYNRDLKTWETNGCSVVEFKKEWTTCSCNHLTKFATSFSVTPNPIDFKYVFTHASFINNTTIYATIIVTLILFILFLIWAGNKDVKDNEMLRALPLPDNKQQDKYIYEILVFTGSCKQAGTDSRVSFILTGDMNETEIRTFGSDFPHKTFVRNGIDVFVMTESKPLGQLLLLRIWHDNCGEGYNASWYLNYIVFRDVQTGEKFEFIAQNWFAVEKGDRQIERVVPVADIHRLSEFDHLFSTTGHKKFVDGHLWFSVFCRRPRNRFTRCQRVASCAAFLYLSMVTNAMWYKNIPDRPLNGFKFGPFSLGIEEIIIGFLSDIITFPPLFLIIFLFQRSRPRVLRRSRIDLALEQQRDVYGQSSTSGSSATKQLPLRKYPRNRSFTLPWVFRIVAWLLCFAIIGATIFFLWAYGIQFGDTKTKKWLTALVVSVLSSVFISQPIKVFLVVMLLSVVCKKVETDEDDADEDEEEPHLYMDDSWFQETGGKPGLSNLRHTRDLNEYEMIKETRQKEVKSWLVIREVFVYLVFMILAISISYGIQDPNAFLMVTTLKTGFVIRKGKADANNFLEIKDTGQYWEWLDTIFIKELRVGKNYANQPPFGQIGFLADRVNRIMGNSILRQVRIKKDRCEGPIALRNFTKCSGSGTGLIDEDQVDYDIGWKEFNNETLPNDQTKDYFYNAFNYTSATELKGIVSWGNLDAYGGGGYVYHLVEDTNKIENDLKKLNENDWIDHRTRAVFIEFSVYNAQVNLFGVVTLLAEFVPGGGIKTDYFIDGIQLIRGESFEDYYIFACEIFYVFFIVSFTIDEFRQLFRQRLRYFKSYGNINEFLLIIFSFTAIGIKIYRHFVVKEALKFFKDTKGSQYVNLQTMKFLTDIFVASVALAVFFGFLKLIKLLRFNRNILTLSRTLIQVAKDLWGFGLILGIVLTAFAFLFYLIYRTALSNFVNFFQSFTTLISVSLNRFEFDEYLESQPVLGPIVFFSFAFIMSIILISLLITIIIQTFENVKKKMIRYKNEAEVIDYTSNLLKNLLNRNSSSTHVPSIEVVQDSQDDVAFDQKMDTMMNYMNKIYFDNRLDMSKPNWRYKHSHFNFDSNEVKKQVYNSN